MASRRVLQERAASDTDIELIRGLPSEYPARGLAHRAIAAECGVGIVAAYGRPLGCLSFAASAWALAARDA